MYNPDEYIMLFITKDIDPASWTGHRYFVVYLDEDNFVRLKYNNHRGFATREEAFDAVVKHELKV